MDLRPELTPPPIDERRFEEICRRIKELNYLTEDCGEEATEEIAEFNSFTGRSYKRHQFRKYWTVQSLEEFAIDAARPDPKPVANITVDELIEVVRRALRFMHDPEADMAECHYYGDIFEANVPLKQATALFSYPLDYDDATNTWGGGRPMGEYNPTPEEIVGQALSGSTWRNL